MLFFGCRSREDDYYYESEWSEASEFLDVHHAFSRAQARKVYVQDVVREKVRSGESGAKARGERRTLVANTVRSSQEVEVARHLLELRGAVCVAGGASMATDVRKAIVEILGKRIEGGEKQAERYLNALKKAGLFAIEAWS